MDKSLYQQLGHSLKSSPKFWVTWIIVLADMGLLYWGLKWVEGNWYQYTLSQICFVLVGLHHFALFHECVHGSAFKGQKWNTLLGHWCSLFCFLPYFPWRHIHREHHLWAGIVDKDPALGLINDFNPDKRTRNFIVKKTWKLWIPLAEFAQTILYWFYPLTLLKEKKLNKKLFWESCFSSAFLIGTHFLIIRFYPHVYTLKHLGPAVLIYLIVQELISLPHHMGLPMFKFSDKSNKLPLWEQHQIARSCYYPFPLGELFALNFNFHVEHHLFPRLPWYELRRARAQVKEFLGAEYNEVPHISWSIKNRQKDCTEVFYRSYDEA